MSSHRVKRLQNKTKALQERVAGLTAENERLHAVREQQAARIATLEAELNRRLRSA